MRCFLQRYNAYNSQWESNTARIPVVCEMRAAGDYKKLSVSSYRLTAAGVTQQFSSSMDDLRLVGTTLGVAERSIQDRILLNISSLTAV